MPVIHRTWLFSLFLSVACAMPPAAGAQRSVKLDLKRTIELATDSSATAQKYKSVFERGKWDYMAYQASRKPQFILNSTPVEYAREFVKRYVSENDRDIYRQQRTFYSSVSVDVTQKVEFLGGELYGSTGLGFLRSFGDNAGNQFSAVPIEVGYRQELLGFNALKWDRLMEPMKMEANEREYAYQLETTSACAAEMFFDLAMAQAGLEMAIDNLKSCDTIYSLGQKMFRIASISQAELQILNLDRTNARNSLTLARLERQKAQNELVGFLGMESGTELELVMPSGVPVMHIDPEEAALQARQNNPVFLTDRNNVFSAQRDVEKARVERRVSATLDLNFGLNQVDENLGRAYGHPLSSDVVSLSVAVPLKDWGMRKSRLMSAKSALEEARTTARKNSDDVEMEVLTAVNEFNEQEQLVENTNQALTIAENAYLSTFQRFASGKATVNDITLAQNRWQSARQNQIAAIRNFWLCYYNIRRITLYDFATRQVITHSKAIGDSVIRK